MPVSFSGYINSLHFFFLNVCYIYFFFVFKKYDKNCFAYTATMIKDAVLFERCAAKKVVKLLNDKIYFAQLLLLLFLSLFFFFLFSKISKLFWRIEFALIKKIFSYTIFIIFKLFMLFFFFFSHIFQSQSLFAVSKSVVYSLFREYQFQIYVPIFLLVFFIR